MTARFWITLTGAIVAAAACGGASEGGGAGAPERPICDGSTGIRLAVFKQSGELADWQVSSREVGSPYLYVDGRCQYWTSPISDADPACGALEYARTGTLRASQAEALAKAISYSDISRLEGGDTYLGEDAVGFTVWDGIRSGGSGLLPPAFELVRSELLDQSVPVDGRFRVGVARKTQIDPLERIFTWPLSRPASDFLLPPEAKREPGHLFLVHDPVEVAGLRALRGDWCDAQRQHGFLGSILIPISRDTSTVDHVGDVVVLRSDLPFTDPVTGLWAPPGPQGRPGYGAGRSAQQRKPT